MNAQQQFEHGAAMVALGMVRARALFAVSREDVEHYFDKKATSGKWLVMAWPTIYQNNENHNSSSDCR